MKFGSLGDLNFMEEPLIGSGPFVGSAVELSAVDRTGFSHRPAPKATSTNVTSADGNQHPTGPVSKGQRPEVASVLSNFYLWGPDRFTSLSARKTLLWRLAIHWRPLDVTLR